jgi:hypothetical protein
MPLGEFTIGEFMKCTLFQHRDNGYIFYVVLKQKTVAVIPARDGNTVTVAGRSGQTISPPLVNKVTELFYRNRTAQK